MSIDRTKIKYNRTIERSLCAHVCHKEIDYFNAPPHRKQTRQLVTYPVQTHTRKGEAD